MGHHQQQQGEKKSHGDWRKEEKHHKHMEQLAKLGAAAAGAYAMAGADPEGGQSGPSPHLKSAQNTTFSTVAHTVAGPFLCFWPTLPISLLLAHSRIQPWVRHCAMHEKHKAKKDPEHARSHRMKEEIAATIAAGSAGFAIHEHHKKKEAKKHARHHH